MAEQRQPFRFRLPWLSAVTAPRPAAEPQLPRPPAEIQAPPQPTTSIPIQRPPFRPAGIAPAQAPPQPPKIEPQSPPPRAARESKVASRPSSPSHATQIRAASVPPLPSRGGTETRVTSQQVSPPRATTQTQVASQTKSPSHAAKQPRAASVPPSPSRTASQTQSAIQEGPPPQSPSRLASRTTGPTSSQPSSPMRKATQVQPTARAVSKPPSPPKKSQPETREIAQPTLNLIQSPSSIPHKQELEPAGSLQPSHEHETKTQIKSEIVSESQYQTASETTYKPDMVVAQPTQASDRVTAVAPTTMAAPKSPAAPQKFEFKPSKAGHPLAPSESEKKFKKSEEKKAAEELVKDGKSEDEKEVAQELVKEEKTNRPVDEEQMRRTVTKLLTAASGSETQTKEFLSATFQTGERKQVKQENFERKTPLISSKYDEKQIKTVSSTHLKDTDTQGNIHQKPDISNRERAPLHKEIKDDFLKFAHKLAVGHPKQPMDGKPVSIITLAGENRGASMQIGSESGKKDGSVPIHRGYKINSTETLETTTDGEGSSQERIPRDLRTKKDQTRRAYINSNTQSVNNSILFNSSVNDRNPGVELVFSHNLAEPIKSTTKTESIETRKAEFSVTPADNLTYQPTVRRRCLRGLFLEPSDSDPDNPEKPRRHGCLYNCGEKSKNEEMGVL